VQPGTYITTSWDDGHPLDFRVAELLATYSLRGTFYVPRTAETGVMTPAQIRELSSGFEVVAHTINHTELTLVDENRARQEIDGSKGWLEDLTGRACSMFCPPRGKFAPQHLNLVQEAGFTGVRTVELLSLDVPRPQGGLVLMPTTLQAHPHGMMAYAKNMARRLAFRNLWLCLVHARALAWPRLVRSLLPLALRRGGVFHLWGHSWELEKTGLWRELEEVLQFMSQFTSRAPALTNSEVCQAVSAGR
jgi:hypothetical protein